MNPIRIFAALMFALALAPQLSDAQVPASDPSARLRAVLPAQVAERVLARIAEARAHQLPAEALENRALKFAAKGVDPINIERSVKASMDSRSAFSRRTRHPGARLQSRSS
jgi:hypothetical protein